MNHGHCMTFLLLYVNSADLFYISIQHLRHASNWTLGSEMKTLNFFNARYKCITTEKESI